MTFFNNTPKSHRFYKSALAYLDQHNITYIKTPNTKMQCTIHVQNIETKKMYAITLKLIENKLYATILNFIDNIHAYTRHIDEFEDFTTLIYALRFNLNESI
jgi:hypothetical protein